MLVKPVVSGANGFAAEQPQMPGDILDSCDVAGPFVVDETAGGVTLTQAQFSQSLSPALEVSGNGGAVATTLPTADDIIKAIKGNVNMVTPPANSPYDSGHDGAVPLQWPAFPSPSPQASFRWIIRNLNTGTTTVTAQASSGVSISGTATVATTKWREYIVKIVAGGTTKVLGCTMTNATKVLNTTDTETLKNIQVGQSVYGTNIGASAKVVAVDYNTGNITVDVNSTGTSASPLAITFTPTVTFTNLRAGDT